jgi:hypothetical protein
MDPSSARPLAAVLVAGLCGMASPAGAMAHSLESSTIDARVTASGVDTSVRVALDTVNQALGTSYGAGTAADAGAAAQAVSAYLAQHLTLTDSAGHVMAETVGEATVEQVEGITSVTVDLSHTTTATDLSTFTVSYDGIIEAIPTHEAVVVLTDAEGTISTAGVLTSTQDVLAVGGSQLATGLTDMVGYGLGHVLAGADHLLFLVVLLLVAPLTVASARWTPRDSLGSTTRSVLAVVTAFTVGHSITLVASGLGWVQSGGAMIEAAIALSVAAAALHAMRPVLPRAEVLIAGLFGLVHGLAFAGILADLGLRDTVSVPALLAFNVGVELAQLLVTALVFPAWVAISRTRWQGPARAIGATVALVAAGGWLLERLGGGQNPFAAIEAAAVDSLGLIAVVINGVALLAWLAHSSRRSGVIPIRRA